METTMPETAGTHIPATTAPAQARQLATRLWQHVACAKAQELARQGSYAQAQALLGELGDEVAADARVLDLLARVQAQQGHFAEAEELWQRARALDPHHPGYAAALTRLASRQVRSPFGRWSQGIAVGGVFAVCALLVGWLLYDGGNTPVAVNRHEVGASDPQQTPVERLSPSSAERLSPSSAERLSPSSGLPAANLPIGIEIPGVVVSRLPQQTKLTFESGLFSQGTRLKPAAVEMLMKLGRQLQLQNKNLAISIVGCSDNQQLVNRRRYRDNTELQLLRAVAVFHHLRETSRLSPEDFSLDVLGSETPPYANDTPTNRARNRTVILLLSEKESDAANAGR